MNKIWEKKSQEEIKLTVKNKSIEQIQQKYRYSTKHNAQNQKHKCIEQIRKVKEQEEKKEY